MTPGLPTVSMRIADLLADPFLFAVPPYQRPYSWSEKEAGQLLGDVLSASGVDSPETGEPDYFLGAMLLLTSAEVAAVERVQSAFVAEVVDGQQRLVTLAILAAALRDIDESEQMRREVSPLLNSSAILPPSRTSGFRIELRGRQQDFLESSVLSPGACSEMPDGALLGESERRILAIREHFITELGQLDGEQRLALIRFIKQACYFLVMITPDIDRAHRMFLVLNGRGKPLSRHDILKAEILSKVPAHAAERALAVWDGAARSLDDENFESFFSHLRTIYGQYRPQVIAGVRAIIADVGGAESFVDTVLAPLAEAYRGILEPGSIAVSSPAGDSIRRSLRYLHRLNGSEWMPAAMIALRRLSDDPLRVAREIEGIERWAHLLRLLCLGGSKRVRRFADVIGALAQGRSLDGPGSPCQLSRDERKAIAYNLRDLHGRNPQLCKLTLLRMNDELSGRYADLEPADYTVEHILPQRFGGTSPWRALFPDVQEREECVQSLGNLLLVSPRQNDRARNQEFPRKREIFAELQDGPLGALTADVLAAATWGPDEVRARENGLMNVIEKVWRIELPRDKIVRVDHEQSDRRRQRAAG